MNAAVQLGRLPVRPCALIDELSCDPLKDSQTSADENKGKSEMLRSERRKERKKEKNLHFPSMQPENIEEPRAIDSSGIGRRELPRMPPVIFPPEVIGSDRGRLAPFFFPGPSRDVN